MKPITDKNRITKAFRKLRKLGYFARQNFLCCQSCGWSAMSDKEAEKAVFYHRQDNESFDEYGNISDYLNMCWSGSSEPICDALASEGLVVIHNGNISERIKVEHA